MSRIPKHELDELKRGLSLLALAQSQGHQFKKHGLGTYACLCPFHAEKTPSCVITPSKGLYHCFGCGAKGSIIDWQMQTTGQSLREAVQFLQARLSGSRQDMAASVSDAGVVMPSAPSSSLTVSAPSAPARQKLADLDDDGQALLRQVVDYYHQNLLTSPEALKAPVSACLPMSTQPMAKIKATVPTGLKPPSTAARPSPLRAGMTPCSMGHRSAAIKLSPMWATTC